MTEKLTFEQWWESDNQSAPNPKGIIYTKEYARLAWNAALRAESRIRELPSEESCSEQASERRHGFVEGWNQCRTATIVLWYEALAKGKP